MQNTTIIDGKAKAEQLSQQIKEKTAALFENLGVRPGLAVVVVGENPASQVYVRNKKRTAESCGFYSVKYSLPEDSNQETLLDLIDELNRDTAIHGILVQLPLPSNLDEQLITQAIVPEKDVDGFHPINFGRLAQGRSVFAPCTPSGILELLDRSCINLKGQRAVVIGRSQIVGKPVALMLLHRHATVTVCHSQTRDLPALARDADVLIAALGRPAFVTSEFVKPGATVIDVGVNRLVDETIVKSLLPLGSPRLQTFARRGSLLVGDVHPAVSETAGALTPVPGGVGPLTVAMLMVNTVRAAEMSLGQAVQYRG